MSQTTSQQSTIEMDADVVVIGGGGAGMAAALSAAESRPEGSVVLVQKIAALGGSTTLSIGYYSAAATRFQDEQGIDDSADRHYHDIQKILDTYNRTGGTGSNYFFDYEGDLDAKDNKALRRVLVENAGGTLDWLTEYGCDYAGPYGEPPHSKPRCHQIKPDTEAYATILGDALDDQGVDVLLETEATELLSTDGVVDGVRVKERGSSRESYTIRANSGVVLATGGYVNNKKLRKKYTTVTSAPPVNEYNTGDGHRMAGELGADLVNMDMQWLRLAIGDPYYTFPELGSTVDDGAILVNEDGERLTNEQNDYDQLFRETLRQPNQHIYLVFDDRIATKYTEWPHFLSIWGQDGKQWAYLDEYRETDVLKIGDSPGSLAAENGFDEETFSETIEEANNGRYDDATGQFIDPFGRREQPDITQPPLYSLGPIQPFSLVTDGGLAVDTEMRVLDESGSAIPGLYAAGVTAGDIFLYGHGHHHAWIFTTGRIAGDAAASRT